VQTLLAVRPPRAQDAPRVCAAPLAVRARTLAPAPSPAAPHPAPPTTPAAQAAAGSCAWAAPSRLGSPEPKLLTARPHLPPKVSVRPRA
jgi:hypothetical protein